MVLMKLNFFITFWSFLFLFFLCPLFVADFIGAFCFVLTDTEFCSIFRILSVCLHCSLSLNFIYSIFLAQKLYIFFQFFFMIYILFLQSKQMLPSTAYQHTFTFIVFFIVLLNDLIIKFTWNLWFCRMR